MQFDNSRIWPYVIALLVVLVVYRRLRRTFGRQPLRPKRMKVRIGIFSVLGCALLPLMAKSSEFVLAEIVALPAGIALGIYGAHRTRFLHIDGQLSYVPHTYTGVAVSLLFVGRLAYRLVHAQSFSDNTTTPLTAALLMVVVGYYVPYYGIVLWKSRRISPEDLETAKVPTAAPM